MITKDLTLIEIKNFIKQLINYGEAFLKSNEQRSLPNNLRSKLIELNKHAFSACRVDVQGTSHLHGIPWSRNEEGEIDGIMSDDCVFFGTERVPFPSETADIRNVASKLIIQEKEAEFGCHEKAGNPDFLFFATDADKDGNVWGDWLDPIDAIEKVVDADIYSRMNFMEPEDYEQYVVNLAKENPDSTILNRLISKSDGMYFSYRGINESVNTLVNALKADEEELEVIEDAEIDLEMSNLNIMKSEITKRFTDGVKKSWKTFDQEINFLKLIEKDIIDIENLIEGKNLDDIEINQKDTRGVSAMLLSDKISSIISICSDAQEKISKIKTCKEILKSMNKLFSSETNSQAKLEDTLARRLSNLGKECERVVKAIDNSNQIELTTELQERIFRTMQECSAKIIKSIESKGSKFPPLALDSQLADANMTGYMPNNKTIDQTVKANEAKKYLSKGNTKIPQDAYSVIDGKKVFFGKWWHNVRQNPKRKPSIQAHINEIASLIPDPEDKKGAESNADGRAI